MSKHLSIQPTIPTNQTFNVGLCAGVRRAYFRLVLPQAELLEPDAWHSSQNLAVQLDGLISYKTGDNYKIQVDVQKPPFLYSYLEYQQYIYL
jgi:hypothetical protein